MDKVLLAVRKEPLLEFHCKQMDHFVGLHFSNNFHFALMVHLVKGKLLFYFLANLVNLIIKVEHQGIKPSVELEFGNVGLCRGMKTGVPGEKPLEQGREPTTNSTHI